MIRHPPRPTLFPYTPLFRSPPHLCHVNLPPLGRRPHLANPARRRASPASRRKRPLRLMAASVAAACPTSRFRFPRPFSLWATSHPAKSSAPPLPQRVSSEFLPCRRAITSSASKPTITLRSFFPSWSYSQTKWRVLKSLLSPSQPGRRALVSRVSPISDLRFPPMCNLPSEPIASFVIASMPIPPDRKSTRLNSSHLVISYAVFCLKKKDREQRTDLVRAATV